MDIFERAVGVMIVATIVLATLQIRSGLNDGKNEIVVRHVVGAGLEDDVVRFARSEAHGMSEYVVEAVVAEDARAHDEHGEAPAVDQHGAKASDVFAEDVYLTLRLRRKSAQKPKEGTGEKVNDKSGNVHGGDYSKTAP